MPLQIPKSGCHWTDKEKDDLGDCHFEMFFTKIDEIQEECLGSPRKQTKQETMTEGLKATHNAQAAANLVGSKFIISRSGRPLHLTTMPTDILRKFSLPDEYEQELGGVTQNNAPAQSGGFSAFATSSFTQRKPASPMNDPDSRRISLAAKCMFLQLAASLEIIYADESGDLFIAEVKKDPNPLSIVEAVFDSGEHFGGQSSFDISFGLLKRVEA